VPEQNTVDRQRGQPLNQVVDPEVSRTKFQRQIEAFKRNEPDYRRQGWFLVSAEFPEVFLILTIPHLRPAPVLFGVLADFANYDVDPPSVQLVNPWTRRLLRSNELLSQLPRFGLIVRPESPAQVGPVSPCPEPAEQASPDLQNAAQSPPPGVAAAVELRGTLLQSWGPESIPFLCIRGVREYHRNPAHTGDSWLLHRGRGEGTLDSILSAIHQHGCLPVKDYLYQFGFEHQVEASRIAQRITVQMNGFVYSIPETDLLVPLPFPS
jgi:Predicted metal binding domain